MRLLTHNLLACLQCEHFPLDITSPPPSSGIPYAQVECTEVEFDEMFTRRMLCRMDYSIFLQGIAAYRRGFQETLFQNASQNNDDSTCPSCPNDAGSSEERGTTTLNLSRLIVAEAGGVRISAEDVVSLPLPETLEELTAAISLSTTSSSHKAEEDESLPPFSVFSTTDVQQQRLLLLLHTLLEGLALRNGGLCCSACKKTYPVEDFIPSFVAS